MTIAKINDSLKQQLKNAGLSKGILDNCLNAKFIAIKEENNEIIGVCFIGGIFNNVGTEIVEKYRGIGLSKILLKEMRDECKNRNISFITSAFKPTNIPSIKAHVKAGFRMTFTFHYNKEEGKEIAIIMPLNKRGELVAKIVKIFNTKIGNIIFAICFKILRPVLKNLLAFSDEVVPLVDLSYSIKNFEKVEDTIKEYKLDVNI